MSKHEETATQGGKEAFGDWVRFHDVTVPGQHPGCRGRAVLALALGPL